MTGDFTGTPEGSRAAESLEGSGSVAVRNGTWMESRSIRAGQHRVHAGTDARNERQPVQSPAVRSGGEAGSRSRQLRSSGRQHRLPVRFRISRKVKLLAAKASSPLGGHNHSEVDWKSKTFDQSGAQSSKRRRYIAVTPVAIDVAGGPASLSLYLAICNGKLVRTAVVRSRG